MNAWGIELLNQWQNVVERRIQVHEWLQFIQNNPPPGARIRTPSPVRRGKKRPSISPRPP